MGPLRVDAERRLHRRVHVACVDAIFSRSRRAALTILFSGDRLDALVLHGRRHDPGVFECM